MLHMRERHFADAPWTIVTHFDRGQDLGFAGREATYHPQSVLAIDKFPLPQCHAIVNSHGRRRMADVQRLRRAGLSGRVQSDAERRRNGRE
jgi:hypothetical protein